MVLAISWGCAAVWVLEEKEREQESWITDKRLQFGTVWSRLGDGES
jgi:hypothetical protein